MARISPADQEKAKTEVKELYKTLERKIGRVPNIFLNLGNSPAALKGFLSLNDAAEQTSLSPKLREQIALSVSQTNRCLYCLSAHTTIAKGTGLSEQEIQQARQGEAQDPRTQAILNFVKLFIENRGNLSNQDVSTLKVAGVSDTELVEIVLVAFVSMFTNYFNLITDPQIDFPKAPELP